MEMLNSSTKILVTSVEFSKVPYSSTLTYFHGCCFFLIFLRMKQMIHIGDCLGPIGNTYSVLLSSHTPVSMEVNTQMEAIF